MKLSVGPALKVAVPTIKVNLACRKNANAKGKTMTPKLTDDQGRTILQVERGKKGRVIRDLKPPPKRKGKKKVKAKKKTDDRMQLQIRVGKKLIENLDAAVAWRNYLKPDDVEDDTRTSLACDAIQCRLDGNGWEPGRTTADVLVGNRTPLLVRVPRPMMKAIDKACDAEGVTRTVWVLDALLAELALVKADVENAQQEAADAA